MDNRSDYYDYEYYRARRPYQPRKVQDDIDAAERRRSQASASPGQAQPVATSQPITDVQARDYERRLGNYLASIEGHERVEAQFTSDYANFQKSPEYQEWKLGSRAAQEEYTGLTEKTVGQYGMVDLSKSYRPGGLAKPGTPGAWLQEKFSGALQASENWIEGGVDWLRQGSKSHLKTSKELQAKGDVWGALGHSTVGMFGRIFTGGAETLTFPFRPVQWGQVAALPVLLADESNRRQIWSGFTSDLGGNIMEISGGVVLGYAGAKGLEGVINKLRGPKIVMEKVSVERPYGWKKTPIKVEAESLGDLRQELLKGTVRKKTLEWKWKVEKIRMIKSEFSSGDHLYSTSGKWRESGSLDFGRAYTRTGEGLIQVEVPLDITTEASVYKLVKDLRYSPFERVFRAPTWIETISREVPNSIRSLGIYGALSGLGSGLASLARPSLRIPQPPQIRSPSIVKDLPYLDQVTRQRLRDIERTIQIPVPVQIPIPAVIPDIIHRQIHKIRHDVKQTSISELLKIPQPVYRPPPGPGPSPVPPPDRRKTRLPSLERLPVKARSSRLRGLAGYEHRNYQIRTPGQVLRALIGGSRK